MPPSRSGSSSKPSRPARAAARNARVQPRRRSASEQRDGKAGPRNARSASRRPRRDGRRATVLGAAVGVLAGAVALGLVTWSSGCSSDSNGSASKERVQRAPASRALPGSDAPDPAAPHGTSSSGEEEPEDAGTPDAPWEGPWLGAMAQQTPVYPTARFSKKRIGYIRRGGKVPVVDKPIKTPACRKGWYPLVDGGYVCGKYATVDLEDPRVRLGVKPADFAALLPYKYAYNKAHGTPLYRAVPSREDMLRYEPYLAKKDEKPAETSAGDEGGAGSADPAMAEADQPSPAAATASEPLLDGGVMEVQDGGAPPVPWWQQEGKEVNVTLADLEESDGTLAKRMAKGFFISVDRTFGWNNRMWYKTTRGLVAPADRMIIPKTPDLHGLELTGAFEQVGFIRSPGARKYSFTGDSSKAKRGSKLARFTAVGLTGETRLADKKRYRETVDGWWMRDRDCTYTEPGPPPADLQPKEKWIDVNIARKTLVAFQGKRPVYATLISPGKRSNIKKRDHRTPTGTYRIREKHVATTMDGDGVVAGDIPYSIQDVPYAQYYQGSYALHGAFWHANFGREMSHGCVNLSPADSKWLFWWTEPALPRGWHGVWATTERPGTRVVIHD